MNKKIIFIMLVFILIIPTGTCFNQINSNFLISSDLPDEFIIEDITSSDGGYHKAKNLSIEWFYFDANFEYNYSVQIGFMIVSRKNFGIVIPGINVYKEGENIFHKRKIFLLNAFSGSSEKPEIYLKERPFILGEINNETGIADYKVSLSLANISVSLNFNSTMKGWKTDNWAIIMPKANVSGTIELNGNKINLKGEGYHEHKWNFPINFGNENKGYFWGRISSENTNLIWTEIYPRGDEKRNLVVLNYGKEKYVKINPDEFKFEIIGYEKKLFRKIPNKFEISIQNDSINMNAILDTLEYHKVNFLFIRYTRYNVKIKGNIDIKDILNEQIDSKSIMDNMRFF